MHYSCIPVRGLQKEVAWILNLLAFFVYKKTICLFFCFFALLLLFILPIVHGSTTTAKKKLPFGVELAPHRARR